MRAFSVFGAIAAATNRLSVEDIQCDRHVEILLLQDATTSYSNFGTDMSPLVDKMITHINDRMGEAVASVALFCDKPVPFRGDGEGRGYIGEIDTCYYNGATEALSKDPQAIISGYDKIYDLYCTGGDYPESSLEALMYAAMDPKVNWSPADKIYTEGQKRIVKVVVLVTDDHPHYAGDALSGILSWNPLDGAPSDGYPRFFDEAFYGQNGFFNADGNKEKYTRLVELHRQNSLNAMESTEYESLMALLGPAVYDLPIEHPGTFEPSSNCKLYEYPTLEVVGKVLNREKVLPVVILSGASVTNTGRNLCRVRGYDNIQNQEDWLKCLTGVYESDLQTAGIENYIVTSYEDAEDLVRQIVEKVDEISRDVSCPAPETTSDVVTESVTASTDDTTADVDTTSDVTTEEQTTTTDETTTTSPEDTTTEEEELPSTATTGGADTTDNGDSSAAVNSTGADEGSESTTEAGTGDNTDGANTNTETTGSSGFVPPPPVVPGNHSSNTAVVAGAAGGASAGAAALAGVLYKKFGAGLLGHNTPGDLAVGEQVETPETPVEREAFEEVTTDMFQ